jgi:nuclear pore complex protein Nup188
MKAKQALIFRSWQDVYNVLESDSGDDHQALDAFLSSSQAQHALEQPFNPFPTASPQSKTAFETAANFKAPADSKYSLEEIKEDALWLSKDLGVDELTGLRLAVLEYQKRDQTQLLDEFTAEEHASLESVCGGLNTETSTLVANALQARSKASSPDSRGRRRKRALQVYFSERSMILACAKLVYEAALYPRADQTGSTLLRIGQDLVDRHRRNDARLDAFANSAIASMARLFDRLQEGMKFSDEGADEVADVRLDWLNSQITEATFTAELLLYILDSEKAVQSRSEQTPARSSQLVLAWFRFMSTYGHLDRFEVVSAPFVMTLLTR